MNRQRLALLVAAPVLTLGGCLGSVMLLSAEEAHAGACGPSGPGVRVDTGALPAGSVAGYRGAQLANAALIINAGQTLGLSARGQTIGVMTAMGESGLQVLDHGDAAGPDSRGLFQQRDNDAWGSLADRMDPTTSATSFFTALHRVDGWETLPPTIAAHRVQRNADPFHYERYWDAAVAVVAALSGVRTVPGAAPGTGNQACTGATPAVVTADGWTKPAVAPVTSHFGLRVHPVTGVYRLHAGTDLGGPCEAPIYAAADGLVTQAGATAGYGTLIAVDHGAGTVTRYAHMYANGVMVRAGDEVTAGQQIGRIGSAGHSTGCHLHYEIHQNGTPVDPVPFHAGHGAPLG